MSCLIVFLWPSILTSLARHRGFNDVHDARSIFKLGESQNEEGMIAATGASLIPGSGAFAQDVPDTNPIANPDGTMTWYTGVSTQFPQVQLVLDACAAGDEIVIMGASLILSINTPDINVRCSTNRTAAGTEWNQVNFWNPTQGDDRRLQ